MAVRVKVRIRTSKDQYAETSALANTGYETIESEVLIPVRVAERLKVWPHLPPNTRIDSYSTAGGTTKVHRIENYAKLEVLVSDKIIEPVRCNIIISEIEDEVLLSDSLLSALGIVIEDPRKGLWRFRDEPIMKLRQSEEVELW